jgi:hypothetical protein
MSVIVIKSETTEYRILVKAGDEELARQEAVKAAISAEEARLSALDAGASEQVATQKAAQTVEDAASALASKQDAEIAAIASEGFATDSGISATASNTAKGLSEAAKVIAIEEAGKSSTSAGQSAASAAAAAASSALITNKAEVNITTAGNILRADGALFKSISEVEFLRNINAYRKAPDSKFFDNKQLIAWDNFDRPNEKPVIQSDSGHPYSIWKGNTIGQVLNNNYFGNDGFVESTALITFPTTKNIGVEFSFLRNTAGSQISAFAIVKDLNNYIAFGRFAKNSALGSGNLFPEIPSNSDYSLFAVINGVATILGSIYQQTMYQGGGSTDSFSGSRLNFIIKYANRGRNDNSSLVVQSLDNPSLRIDVNVSNLNTTFVNPSDYNRIAIIANIIQVMSYKVANLDL